MKALKKYLSHHQDIMVTVNDLDFLERLKPSSVMGYFQDIATTHADIIGIGFKEMLDKNMVWVMIKLSVVIKKHPKVGEVLKVCTFPEKPKNLAVNRGYYLVDKEGKEVARGLSTWCVLDKNTRRILRCAPIFSFDDSVFNPETPIEKPGVLEVFPDEKTEILSWQSFIHKVQPSDLDRNKHMNNTRYFESMANACGLDFLQNNVLRRLDINFISELFCGEELQLFYCHREGKTLFDAIRLDTKKGVFRAVAHWEKASE